MMGLDSRQCYSIAYTPVFKAHTPGVGDPPRGQATSGACTGRVLTDSVGLDMAMHGAAEWQLTAQATQHLRQSRPVKHCGSTAVIMTESFDSINCLPDWRGRHNNTTLQLQQVARRCCAKPYGP